MNSSISSSVVAVQPDRLRLSVVICAHNPKPDLFARTLRALDAQDLPRADWELLVVDSASASPLGSTLDLSWHGDARVVREETPGLTRARLRAIREARGDLLVFVDDDNILDPDYLGQAQHIAVHRPWLGAWSGSCRPEFQHPPAEWTKRYWGNLVIREVQSDRWSNLPLLHETMPYGAGLCVRQHVARRYADLHATGRRPFSLDRVGESLMSGGDNDLAACACDVGLGVGVIASLRLTHVIPPGRLAEPYLLRLVEDIAFSGVVFYSYWSETPTMRSGWKHRLADKLREAFMTARERRFFRATRRGERRGVAFISSRSPTAPLR